MQWRVVMLEKIYYYMPIKNTKNAPKNVIVQNYLCTSNFYIAFHCINEIDTFPCAILTLFNIFLITR